MNCFGWSMIWPFVVARPMVRDFPDCPVTHFASYAIVLDTCLSDRDREQTEFINNQDVSSKCRFTHVFACSFPLAFQNLADTV